MGGFSIALKVSLMAGVCCHSPIWLYQLWAFLAPGLHRNEEALHPRLRGHRRARCSWPAPGWRTRSCPDREDHDRLRAGQHHQPAATRPAIGPRGPDGGRLRPAFELPLVLVLLNFTGVISGAGCRLVARHGDRNHRLRRRRHPHRRPAHHARLAAPIVVLYFMAVGASAFNDSAAGRAEAAPPCATTRRPSSTSPPRRSARSTGRALPGSDRPGQRLRRRERRRLGRGAAPAAPHRGPRRQARPGPPAVAGRPVRWRPVVVRPGRLGSQDDRRDVPRRALRRQPSPRRRKRHRTRPVPRAVRVRPRSLPDRGLPGAGGRQRRPGRRAHRVRQDHRRRVRRPPGPRRGPQVLLHHADQGAVQPEVQRPGQALRRRARSACSPATTASTGTRR